MGGGAGRVVTRRSLDERVKGKGEAKGRGETSCVVKEKSDAGWSRFVHLSQCVHCVCTQHLAVNPSTTRITSKNQKRSHKKIVYNRTAHERTSKELVADGCSAWEPHEMLNQIPTCP